AAHASNAFAGFDDVIFLRGEDNLASFKLPQARFFTQTFCRTCASPMPRLDPERGIAVVPMGGLDDDPGIRPQDHIFVGSKAGWHEITDDLPRHQEGPPSAI
ncbi:MAG: GFA family protein, partial [Alphaproteobacteria bacterium]|nr:GFA family protein [Alphaproteobacteria bacterium]